MLEASSELRLAFQASISTLNWDTPALIESTFETNYRKVPLKQIIGIKRGLNCCGVILLLGYKVGSIKNVG